jgi:hypothetical protein
MPVGPSSTDLNNEACSLVELRRYDEAAAHLRKALSSIKAEVEAEVMASSLQRNSLEDDAIPCADEGVSLDDETEEVLSGDRFSHQDVASPKIDDANYFYEEDSIAVDPTVGIYAKLIFINFEDSLFFALRSFAVTFNLAVTSHLRSIELQREGKKLLSLQTMGLAKKLYLLALQIEGSETFGTHLPAACFNNLAKVCRSMGADEESKYYDHLLLSNLILLIDTGHVSAPSKVLNGFMKNVTYLLLKSAVVASAA